MLPDFENMSKKELRELTTRLRLVKPKRRKGYKQEITEHQRLQLEAELRSRGFDASETDVDLLLRGGSLPSGAGCAGSIVISDSRRMTNGVSDTEKVRNEVIY